MKILSHYVELMGRVEERKRQRLEMTFQKGNRSGILVFVLNIHVYVHTYTHIHSEKCACMHILEPSNL